MAYSDLQMKNATQVAYKDFQFAFEELRNAGETPPFTISELCNQKGTTIKNMFPDLDGQDISQWKIVDYYDSNDDTGFYGCVIDVGNGDAIVAFRGSEGALDLSNLQHDWIEADLKLLNNTMTNQQAEVYKFMKQISQSDYIDDYDSIGLTGHSLGGNLAMHAAVVSAEPGIGLAGKLEKCISFDGPGNSTEYNEKFAAEIAKISSKVTHYKWSPVGGLLYEFPGVKRISLKFTEKDDFIYNLISRHDTKSIEFDGENAIRGNETAWDIITSKFTQGLDRMPSAIGDTMVTVVSGLLYMGIWSYNEMFDEDKQLTNFGKTLISAAVIAVCSNGITNTVAFLGGTILIVAAAFCATVAFEFVYEALETIVNYISEKVSKVFTWVAQKADELRQYIANCLGQVRSWFSNIFGYGNVAVGSKIAIDTYKLAAYAQRLNRVNRRLYNLDSRLDSLYWRIGLQDLYSLLNLVSADINTGYSYRLKCCENYLNNTANVFERTENSLKNML